MMDFLCEQMAAQHAPTLKPIPTPVHLKDPLNEDKVVFSAQQRQEYEMDMQKWGMGHLKLRTLTNLANVDQKVEEKDRYNEKV